MACAWAASRNERFSKAASPDLAAQDLGSFSREEIAEFASHSVGSSVDNIALILMILTLETYWSKASYWSETDQPQVKDFASNHFKAARSL